MYSKKLAIPLIIAFLALAFSPLIYNAFAKTLGHYPEIQKPKGECVENADWMRANHMLLLQEWRINAIRSGAEGGRIYHSFTYAKEFHASTNTCWDCHGDKTVFCDKCHDYVGIKPECWDCHWNPSFEKPLIK
ncbi:MAG: sulfate reduction electron transfer complex DsrMKJOP subunit DsrJ [Archaeoglobaceae archaeon]